MSMCLFLLYGSPYFKITIQSLDDSSYREARESMGFTMAKWLRNLPVMQETQEMRVRSLGQEDTLEEEIATYSNIPA